MALHEQCVGVSQEWYTPPHVFEKMGVAFDLDVASPGGDVVFWVTAKRHLTHSSLEREWQGFVWMNPPFGGRNGLVPWLEKFFAHGNGVALVPDRTSAPWWQRFVPKAGLVLFVSPKLKFINGEGDEIKSSPPQGTCLLAASHRGVNALLNASERGLGVAMEPRRAVR